MVWEHFHHQADIGIRGTGDSLEQAFEEAAVALMGVICSPEKVQPQETVRIECKAAEKDILFADWINTLIYEMDTRKILFSQFEVRIENYKLNAKAWGEPIDTVRHEPAVEVKAATFMELKVFQNEQNQWIAQCVVDV